MIELLMAELLDHYENTHNRYPVVRVENAQELKRISK